MIGRRDWKIHELNVIPAFPIFVSLTRRASKEARIVQNWAKDPPPLHRRSAHCEGADRPVQCRMMGHSIDGEQLRMNHERWHQARPHEGRRRYRES